MNDLTPEARALLDSAMPGLEPTAEERARVRSVIASRLAIGVAAGVSTLVASKVAAGGTTGGTALGVAAKGAAASAAAASGAGVSTAVGASVATAAGASVVASSTVATVAGVSLMTKVVASIALVGAIGIGATYPLATAPADRSATSSEAKTSAGPPQGPRSAKSVARALDIPPPDPTLVAAPAEIASPTTVPGLVPRVNPPAAPSAPVVVVPSGADVPSAVATATATVSAPASAIGVEVALLRSANAEMQAGRADRALAMLDDHVHRFPSGALIEEREAARILALCAVGRTDESREAQGRFLREHPRSPQVARVRAACGVTVDSGLPSHER